MTSKLKEKDNIKREHPALQNLIFLHFCVKFLPSWIRIQPTKMNVDPDPEKCYEGTKAFLKGRKPEPGLFVTGNFGQFPCSWIQTCITNEDQDPGQPNQCGAGSTKLTTILLIFLKYRYMSTGTVC